MIRSNSSIPVEAQLSSYYSLCLLVNMRVRGRQKAISEVQMVPIFVFFFLKGKFEYVYIWIVLHAKLCSTVHRLATAIKWIVLKYCTRDSSRAC